MFLIHYKQLVPWPPGNYMSMTLLWLPLPKKITTQLILGYNSNLNTNYNVGSFHQESRAFMNQKHHTRLFGKMGFLSDVAWTQSGIPGTACSIHYLNNHWRSEKERILKLGTLFNFHLHCLKASNLEFAPLACNFQALLCQPLAVVKESRNSPLMRDPWEVSETGNSNNRQH